MATPTYLKPKFSNLEDCVRMTEQVSMNFGGSCSEEEFSKLIDISINSSYFGLRLNSIRAYGLLDYKEGHVHLTSLGEKITTPTDAEERSAALLTAIVNFLPFKSLSDRYKGRPIPEKQFIENTFISGGKKKDEASAWAEIFLKSAKYAGLFKAGQVFFESLTDRLSPAPPTPKQSTPDNSFGDDENKQGWLMYPVPTPSGMAKIVVPEELSRAAWEKLKKLLDAIEPAKNDA
ncbi:MAG: hypothetical protein ABIU05_01345 [Nitrospirales bacterium]